jgi:hypothetical protein
MEGLNAYHHWVNSVVLPIAFQWIEEHKPEVYADVPEEMRDDIGVAIAAAFKLVKELSAYKTGTERRAAYMASGEVTWDPATINPVWTRITKKVRAQTEETFAEETPLLGETIG